jgi:uncharacterized protein YfaS (alpha-2-macroglobulin family)
VGPGSTTEVRFSGQARAVGRARLQMTVRLGSESDAFEEVLPVEILAAPETVASYGSAGAATTVARESLSIPGGVVPGFGGLDLEVSSTALVGLGEGARYLVQYPYGCAEQKASTSLALFLAADLGDAFSLPGMAPGEMKSVSQATLKELERFQCDSGGFAYWPGSCGTVSPYLTAYVLHVMRSAVDLGYTVDAGVRARAYDYLQRELGAQPPAANEEWWPAYTAWQAFAVKVLTEGGRTADSHVTRIYGYRDRLPVFGLAYLHDALMAAGETSGERVADLRRRMLNAVLPEAGEAHVRPRPPRRTCRWRRCCPRRSPGPRSPSRSPARAPAPSTTPRAFATPPTPCCRTRSTPGSRWSGATSPTARPRRRGRRPPPMRPATSCASR